MKKTLIYISFLMLLSGCYYDVADELYPESTASGCDTTNITYSGNIKSLINLNCANTGCHEPGGQSPDLSDYTGVSTNAASIKQRAVIDKTMPPAGPLPACDIKALEIWIDNGAQNN